MHAIVDDHSRLAYAEIHPDARAKTAAAFLERALAFYAAHGISARRLMTDNAWAYTRSRVFRQFLARRGIKHLKTKPYRPRTNGKVERFHQTMARKGKSPASRLTSDWAVGHRGWFEPCDCAALRGSWGSPFCWSVRGNGLLRVAGCGCRAGLFRPSDHRSTIKLGSVSPSRHRATTARIDRSLAATREPTGACRRSTPSRPGGSRATAGCAQAHPASPAYVRWK